MPVTATTPGRHTALHHGTGAYAFSQMVSEVAIVVGVFSLLAKHPSFGIWVVLGRGTRLPLTGPKRMQTINGTMAVLLVASLNPIHQH